jgi:hypothetical protein
MELNYRKNNTNSKGISLNSYEDFKDFTIGGTVICKDDKQTLNITNNQSYEILLIYEANCSPDSTTIFLLIADDGDEICGYEIKRFIPKHEWRSERISAILN